MRTNEQTEGKRQLEQARLDLAMGTKLATRPASFRRPMLWPMR